jgi:hypothetical protein
MAYTKFEQTYVDAYLNNMYPDVEEEVQPQDTMLAAAPTTDPTGQVTVSGFQPQQVRTDVQPELGVARPIPQNKAQEALGYIGELLTKAGVQLDKVGIDIPVLGRISLKDLTVGESGKVLEDMALGFYPVEGAGGFISGTTRIKPDPALELLNIAPIAGAAAKVAGKGVVKAGQAVAPKAAEMAEGYMRSIGGIADIAPVGPRTNVVSTRLPTAVKATEDPLASNLIVDFEAIKKDPEAFKHNMGLVQQYPNFVSKARNPEKRAEDFIAEVKDNLLYLYDKVPDQTRQRSKLWYDGARNIVDDWTGKYGANDNAISGVLAVLSPQKDWFMNVSLGERVLDTMTNKQSFKWDSSMDDMAKIIWVKPQYAPMVDAIRGKTLAELDDPGLKAMWLRTYDQVYNPREHQIVNPEGTFAGVRLTDKGVPYKTGWGSLNEIGKAINIFENPTLANISNNLGQQHKVRNFYNNIYDPTNPAGYVTVDTHAVAAGLLRPLSGASTEVAHNFGSNMLGQVGPKNSSITGVQGTYGLYAEAYRRAAQERGVLPREMQSITWEAVRGLFPDTFKNEKNSKLIDSIWLKYRKGQISQTEARNEVFKSANGINPPEWERSGLRSGAAQEIQPTADQGKLSGSSVPRGNPGDMGSGKRGKAAKGNTTSVTGQPGGMAIGEQ